MGESSAELESRKNTHAVRAVTDNNSLTRNKDTCNNSKVTEKRAKQMQPEHVSHDPQQKDDSQSFFLPADIQSECEIVTPDLVEPDLLDIDLEEMIDSLAMPDLLSPLSSVLSESGYDSCSSPTDRADLSADDSLTDLFPDLAYDPTSLILA